MPTRTRKTTPSEPAPSSENTVERENLLATLESVSAGLAKRDMVQQGSCLVFRKGEVLTFNDEISCRAPTGLDDSIEGAVSDTGKLLKLLRKSKARTLALHSDAREPRLLIQGGREKSWHRWDSEIKLPLDQVERPTHWQPLHVQFNEALGVVHRCADRESPVFALTCVHIHPNWVEAGSNTQICRWDLPTGIAAPTIVPWTSIQHIALLGMTELAETPRWLHFRNPNGMVLSCRRYTDTQDFPDLTPFFVVEGKSITLPDALEGSIEKAAICCSQDMVEEFVQVILTKGKLRIIGEGANNGFEETRPCEYVGPRIDFLIAPELLLLISRSSRECVVSEDKLSITTGSYRYVTCLSQKAEKGKEE